MFVKRITIFISLSLSLDFSPLYTRTHSNAGAVTHSSATISTAVIRTLLFNLYFTVIVVIIIQDFKIHFNRGNYLRPFQSLLGLL